MDEILIIVEKIPVFQVRMKNESLSPKLSEDHEQKMKGILSTPFSSPTISYSISTTNFSITD
jgi:hypothetical protein